MRPKSKKPVSAPKPAFVKSFPTNKSHPSMLLSPVPWRNCKSSVVIPNKAQKVYEQELTFRKAEETEEQKIHEAIAQTAGGVVQAAGLGQTQGPACDHPFRGPRWSRQRRHHQGNHRAGQPARLPIGSAPRSSIGIFSNSARSWRKSS